ncbi:MAG: carboxypeptidase-like regulatory domain-containing protein [Methanomicrobiales archaeon]|nr:carboxypeptidase-like regulatory domain-containing protein [Methanomicrobiales archaeon]
MSARDSAFILAILILACLALHVNAVPLQVQVYEASGNMTPLPYGYVFVNGALAGKTGANGILVLNHAGTSTLEILVQKAGYEDWSGMVGKSEPGLAVHLNRKALTVNVTVIDADTLSPISNASVVLKGENASVSAQTGPGGTAVLPAIALGGYTVEVHAINYVPREMQVGLETVGRDLQIPLLTDNRFSIVVRDRESGEVVVDAGVTVDDDLKGTTDVRGILTLPIPRDKIYYLKVARLGYAPYLERRLISSSEAVVPVLLERAPEAVRVIVHDEVEHPVGGAEVFVGGTSHGKSDTNGKVSLPDLAPGEYIVDVRHPEYTGAKRSVILDGKGGEVSFNLTPLLSDVIIATEDLDGLLITGAEIAIDGRYLGVSGENGEIRTKLRTNRTYLFTAGKEGYFPGTTQREVPTGDLLVRVVVPLIFDTGPITMTWMLTGGVIGAIVVLIITAVLLHRRRGKGRRPSKERRSQGSTRKGEI